MNGFDCYGAVPTALLEGYSFIGRYVAQQPGKCIVASEVAEYHGAGKSIILVYEDNAGDALGGAPVGAAKAVIARPVLESIGWPSNLPVHFAVDMPGYSADLPLFVACAKAFAAGIDRPPAIYGDVDTCTAAYQAGIRFLWQFGENRAPGITVLQSAPTQLDGYNIDPDEALVANYGQWAPPQPPTPKPEDEPMFIVANPANKKALFLVSGARKQPIGNTAKEGALTAQKIATLTMTEAEFESLIEVDWGTF